jgi:hypothetical protein
LVSDISVLKLFMTRACSATGWRATNCGRAHEVSRINATTLILRIMSPPEERRSPSPGTIPAAGNGWCKLYVHDELPARARSRSMKGRIRKYPLVSFHGNRHDTHGHTHRGIGRRCRHRSRCKGDYVLGPFLPTRRVFGNDYPAVSPDQGFDHLFDAVRVVRKRLFSLHPLIAHIHLYVRKGVS